MHFMGDHLLRLNRMLRRKCHYFVFKRHASASVRTAVVNDSNENISSKSHIFKQKLFSTHTELAQHLVQNCIYNSRGLIILNKPYGLKKEQKTEFFSNVQIPLHPSVSSINHLSFIEVLPHLNDSLVIDELNLVKLPERHISGISILSSSEKVTNRIRKFLRNPTLNPYTYLALCVGIPKVEEHSTKLGITLQVKNNAKKAILLDSYSKNSLKSHKTFPLTLKHRVLSVNKELNVSLIQLTVNRNKWHCLRLYCAANLFAPCLGDWIMAPRVRYINNVPVLADPFNPVTNSDPIFSDDVLNALQIKRNDLKSIPLHMHLSQLDLSQYFINDGIFIAKPPEYFLWSCQRLGISVPEVYLNNRSFSSAQSLTE